MKNLKIFCTSINYLKILDKLPNYILKIGLGNSRFPNNWHNDKTGDNISHLNKNYGELTGIYWIWKNLLSNFNADDLIGNCHYRKLWLNDLYPTKQKKSKESLYNNLLSNENNLLKEFNTFQVQPIIFNNKNLFEDFKIIHKNDSLEKSVSFLNPELAKLFEKHLNRNIFYPLNMFITTPKIFEKYCETIFPWLEKCYEYCMKKNLCDGYNTRLPAFLAERFTSFWFSQYSKSYFSYARLGNFFLSNTVNSIINPIKIPYTFKMYPTIHKY
jgi:hypothetical protein